VLSNLVNRKARQKTKSLYRFYFLGERDLLPPPPLLLRGASFLFFRLRLDPDEKAVTVVAFVAGKKDRSEAFLFVEEEERKEGRFFEEEEEEEIARGEVPVSPPPLAPFEQANQ